jgi:hypothetical protein
MRQLSDEPIETFLARLPEADRAALTAGLGQAVLSASHAAACLARTGRYREATVFQLLGFLASAQGDLHAAEEAVRERLQPPEPLSTSDPPDG